MHHTEGDGRPCELTRRFFPTYSAGVRPLNDPSPTDLLFGALAHPVRRRILDVLLAGDRTAQEIADGFDLARPSVAEHLSALKRAGLVRSVRDGRFQRYSITPSPLHEVHAWLQPYERFWRERTAGLGQLLDDLTQDSP